MFVSAVSHAVDIKLSSNKDEGDELQMCALHLSALGGDLTGMSSLAINGLVKVYLPYSGYSKARLTQVVEYLFCNEDVRGSNPRVGSRLTVRINMNMTDNIDKTGLIDDHEVI